MCFLHPVPLCMQFCKFSHLFPPANNGLLLRKAGQDLTCAQDVMVHLHRGHRFIVSSKGLLRRVESALTLTPGENIPLERESNPGRQITSAMF